MVIFQHDAENSIFFETMVTISSRKPFPPDAESGFIGENPGHGEEHSLP
jgi:hypothetical protein